MAAHHRSKSKDLPGQGLFGFGDEDQSQAQSFTFRPRSERPFHKPFTDAEEAEICRRYSAGESAPSLATELGVSFPTMGKILKRGGVVTRGSREKIPEEVEREVCRLYAERVTMKEITKRHKVSMAQIGIILKKYGIELHGNSFVTEEQKAEMVRLYLEGVPVRKLRRRFRADESNIRAWLIERGVTIRSLSESNRRLALDETVFDDPGPEARYWIGFLMADGCITETRSGKVVNLSINTDDESHLMAFRSFLGSEHKIDRQHNRQGYGGEKAKGLSKLSVCSLRLADALARFGVVPRKSKSAKVVGLENDRDFWRGAVDGDGWVSDRNGIPKVGLTGSQSIVGQFRDFVRSYIPEFRAVPHSNPPIYALLVQHTAAQGLIEVLYGDCAIALPRKWTTARRFLENPYVSKNVDRSDVTLEIIDELYRRYGAKRGAWRRIARQFGMSDAAFCNHKRRLTLRAPDKD